MNQTSPAIVAPPPSNILLEARLLLTVSTLLVSSLCGRYVLSESDPKRPALLFSALFISSILYDTWESNLWPSFPFFFSLSRTCGTWIGAWLVTSASPPEPPRASSLHPWLQKLCIPLLGLLWGLEELFSHGSNARPVAVVKGSLGFWTALLAGLALRTQSLDLYFVAGVLTGLGVALAGAVFTASEPASIIAGLCFSARLALTSFIAADRGLQPARLMFMAGPLAVLMVLVAFCVELGVSSAVFWSRHVLEAVGVALPGGALAFGANYFCMQLLGRSGVSVAHSWLALCDIGLLPVAARAAGLEPLGLTPSVAGAIGSLLAAAFGALGINPPKAPADLGDLDDAAVAASAAEEKDWLLHDDGHDTARDLSLSLGVGEAKLV